jgi:hypothetical protein
MSKRISNSEWRARLSWLQSKGKLNDFKPDFSVYKDRKRIARVWSRIRHKRDIIGYYVKSSYSPIKKIGRDRRKRRGEQIQKRGHDDIDWEGQTSGVDGQIDTWTRVAKELKIWLKQREGIPDDGLEIGESETTPRTAVLIRGREYAHMSRQLESLLDNVGWLHE